MYTPAQWMERAANMEFLSCWRYVLFVCEMCFVRTRYSSRVLTLFSSRASTAFHWAYHLNSANKWKNECRTNDTNVLLLVWSRMRQPSMISLKVTLCVSFSFNRSSYANEWWSDAAFIIDLCRLIDFFLLSFLHKLMMWPRTRLRSGNTNSEFGIYWKFRMETKFEKNDIWH